MCFLGFIDVAQAKVLKILDRGGLYTLVVPDDYKYYPKFLGLDHVTMSPQDPSLGTSSLSLTITGIPDSKFNSEELQASQNLYQDGRKKYINERGFKLVDFIPYKLEKTPQGHNIHTVGVVYSNDRKITLDKSYMIECPLSFLHAKFVGDVALVQDTAKAKAINYVSVPSKRLETAILGIKCNKE
jgi:hypothetical protein